MFRLSYKKILSLSFPVIYFAALILGTLCAFDSPTEQSHHHGRTVSHSASCLLACAATVTDRTQMVPLTLSLLFIGTVLTFRKTLLHQSLLLRLHSRAPPL
ncbi:MAG: hypothetical protein LLH30_04720 [Candidatus Manganitrophus sp. SA1]|nr:hypothetical protein [Candidatus Manganitrophus morganii]